MSGRYIRVCSPDIPQVGYILYIHTYKPVLIRGSILLQLISSLCLIVSMPNLDQPFAILLHSTLRNGEIKWLHVSFTRLILEKCYCAIISLYIYVNNLRTLAHESKFNLLAITILKTAQDIIGKYSSNHSSVIVLNHEMLFHVPVYLCVRFSL